MDDTTQHKPPLQGGRLPVHFWPDTPPIWTDGVCVIAVRTEHSQQRDRPRQQIRHAVRATLASLLDIARDAIHLPDAAGSTPRVVFDRSVIEMAKPIATVENIGYSISHESGLSVAAINLRGAIGIDVMQVQDIADWQAVADDYLGPDVARTLAALAPAQRANAFASAWTAREAYFKCLGVALQEWESNPTSGRKLELVLPDGYFGCIAMPS